MVEASALASKCYHQLQMSLPRLALTLLASLDGDGGVLSALSLVVAEALVALVPLILYAFLAALIAGAAGERRKGRH